MDFNRLKKALYSSDEEEAYFKCDICDTSFTGIITYEQHMNGKKHQKRATNKRIQLNLTSQDNSCGGGSCEESQDIGVQDFACDICETLFNGVIPYKQHMKSRRHKKALRMKKARKDAESHSDGDSKIQLQGNDAHLSNVLQVTASETFRSCLICEKQFTGPELYSLHMKSRSHSKRVLKQQLLKNIKTRLNSHKDLTNESDLAEDSEHPKVQKDRLKQKLESVDRKKVLTDPVSAALNLTSRDHVKSKDDDKSLEDPEARKDLLEQKLESKDCNKVHTDLVSSAKTRGAYVKSKHDDKFLEDLKILMPQDLDDNFFSSEDEQPDEVLACDVCNMIFCKSETAKDHVKSKEHQKAMKVKDYLKRKYQFITKSDENHTVLNNEDNELGETDCNKIEFQCLENRSIASPQNEAPTVSLDSYEDCISNQEEEKRKPNEDGKLEENSLSQIQVFSVEGSDAHTCIIQ